MSMNKIIYHLLSTGLTQEDTSRHDRTIVDWYVKNRNEQSMYCFKCKQIKSFRKQDNSTERL